MPDLTIAAGLSFTAQFVTAMVMTFLLIGFYRQYTKTYVYQWMLSWAALAVGQLGIVAEQWTITHWNAGPLHPLRLGPAILASACAYISVVWVAFGTYELVRRRPVRLRESKWILIVAAAGGALVTLPYAGSSGSPAGRHLARFGVYGLLSGIAFILISLAIWQTRKRRAGVGSAVLAIALMALAAQQLREATMAFLAFPTGLAPEIPLEWNFLHLLLYSLIGLGMIASLLEDEREAAAIAADQ